MRSLLAISTVALLASLSACSDDGAPSAEEPSAAPTSSAPAETFEVDSTEDAESPSNAPSPPNVGETALQVGEMRDGSFVDTTLYEVKAPLEPMEFRDPAPGNMFVGLRIEQCLDESAPQEQTYYSTFNGEWAAVMRNGIEYSGNGSSWDDWPSPKFPETVGMIPGRCLKGWLAIEVPEGVRFTSLLWRPEGTPAAEWLP